MTSLGKILSDMNKLPKKPKPTKLQMFLNKQEKEGIKKQKKNFTKKMKKLENSKKSPVKSASTKKPRPPGKLELTKADNALLKKIQMYGKKKKTYVSPNKSKSPKSIIKI